MYKTKENIFELEQVSVRLVKERPLLSKIPITSPIDAVELIGEDMYDLDREEMRVLFLDGGSKPIAYETCSIGTINRSLAEPREMIKAAFLLNAAYIVLLHNHPSGSCQATDCDNMVTERINKICNLIGITLLDHVIVSSSREYYSYADKMTQSLKKLSAPELEIYGSEDYINLPGLALVAEG